MFWPAQTFPAAPRPAPARPPPSSLHCPQCRYRARPGPEQGPGLGAMAPPVESRLARAAAVAEAGVYGGYHPAKAKVAEMSSFTYVLPNGRTFAEMDQKYLRPARDAALEGKKTPKQALDEVAAAAQQLLDEANK